MRRCIIALLLVMAGCAGGGSKPAGPPPAVTATVDLENAAAGAPDAGTRAGHGNETVVATASEVFSFVGRVAPPDSTVTVSEGVVRVESSGRFTVGLASPARGSKEVTVRATHAGRRPWSLRVRVVRGRASRVRVPDHDADAPSAAVLLVPLDGRAPQVQPSPSRAGEHARVIALRTPRFRAVAAVRDARGGTGRIRLVIESRTRCAGRIRQSVQTLPPAQILNVAVPPGAWAPVERQRSKLVKLPATRGCSVLGELFAEGTDAHGRQAVTAHIGFTYSTPPGTGAVQRSGARREGGRRGAA